MATKKSSRFVWFGLLTAIAISILTALGVWNKPHPTANDEPAIPVTSEALYKAYTENEKAANAAYLNKILEVKGTVSEVSTNQDGMMVALLQTEDPLGGVQCTFAKTEKPTLRAGQQASVKGFCNGYTIVVLLNDCLLKQ